MQCSNDFNQSILPYDDAPIYLYFFFGQMAHAIFTRVPYIILVEWIVSVILIVIFICSADDDDGRTCATNSSEIKARRHTYSKREAAQVCGEPRKLKYINQFLFIYTTTCSKYLHTFVTWEYKGSCFQILFINHMVVRARTLSGFKNNLLQPASIIAAAEKSIREYNHRKII